jgi:hypothetical protein
MNKLKLIKAIVCILTFLLVFGTLVLIGTIYKKARYGSPLPKVTASLDQPTGSIVADYKIIGDEMYILIKNGGISDRIIIYNRQLGKTAATITLN